MVSLPTFGTSRRLTASSTTSRTVQRARPSGGSLQNHRDDALLLPVIQHFGCSRPLLLVECAFQAALFVSVADLANGLWRQRDKRGNPRGTDALGQLRKRHRAENDSHLLDTAAQ